MYICNGVQWEGGWGGVRGRNIQNFTIVYSIHLAGDNFLHKGNNVKLEINNFYLEIGLLMSVKLK